MLNVLKAIIFGIVEGITEWVPVSSTGHLIILDEFISLDVSENFYKVFEVVIQLGAVGATLLIFIKKIWPFGKCAVPLGKKGIFKYIKKSKFILWLKIAISCIPAVIVGLTIDDFVNEHFYNAVCVSIALIVVGIAFIVIEILMKDKQPRIDRLSEIGYDTALYIGLFQVLAALFPGTSRSGATILGALILGISRGVATEYTFFLAIPVMFGASILKIFKYGLAFSLSEIMVLIVGCVTAFIVSLFVIKLFTNYIKKHDFKVFGIYRVILGIIVLLICR